MKPWTDRPECVDCGAGMKVADQFQVFEPEHVSPLCCDCYCARLKHDSRRPVAAADDDGASLHASGEFYAAQLERRKP